MSTTDFRLVSSRKPINSYQQSTKYGDSGGFTLVETWRRHNGITIRIQTLLSSNVRLAFIKTDVAFSSGKGRFIKISYPISLVRVGWCEFDNFITVLLRCLTVCVKYFIVGWGISRGVPRHPGDGGENQAFNFKIILNCCHQKMH